MTPTTPTTSPIYGDGTIKDFGPYADPPPWTISDGFTDIERWINNHTGTLVVLVTIAVLTLAYMYRSHKAQPSTPAEQPNDDLPN